MLLALALLGIAAFATLIAWAALKVASREDDRLGLDPPFNNDRQTS